MGKYDIEITKKIIAEHGFKDNEYENILKIMGRVPTYVELGIFSAMWSEHCSYKHSKHLLKKFPTKGKYILQGPGENAGIVDSGTKMAVAFKIESHNHPSAVEPFQGAATGIGGILRDVFTMGARPIACLDSLRFGNIKTKKTQHLFAGVVDGIGAYGNCVGIPTIAGETIFEDVYEDNCLVNAMAIGLVDKNKIAKGIAKGVGNPVIYIGSTTGRDGIHGATFASVELTEATKEKRSSVQVADPFMEKLLLEATLELIEKKLVVGIQDMGAAGLTSSSTEMSYRGGVGMEIDIDKVPKREKGMNAYEVMLSESQERMLMVATKGKEKAVEKVLTKWGLHAVVIGKVIKKQNVVIKEGGKIVADMPVEPVTDSNHKLFPRKNQIGVKPKYLKDINIKNADIKTPENLEATFKTLVASQNIACKNMVWEEYDHMVQTNTIVLPGSDAAVIDMKGTDVMIATSVDCNGRYTYLDPFRGGAIAVCESARNVACSGAEPAALTNCLNYGSPENKEIFWQFEQSLAGMRLAAKALKTPVTGGNVSFYNESPSGPIYPTPVIGMIGFIKDKKKRYATQFFKTAGDKIILLGQNKDEIGASEYLKVIHGLIKGPVPEIEMKEEIALQKTLREGIKKGIIKSAHDISDGGLSIALAESCISGKLHGKKILGAYVEVRHAIREDSLLFGETQSRAIVSVSEDKLEALKKIADKHNLTIMEIGKVGGDSLIIKTAKEKMPYVEKINMKLLEIENLWMNGVKQYVG